LTTVLTLFVGSNTSIVQLLLGEMREARREENKRQKQTEYSAEIQKRCEFVKKVAQQKRNKEQEIIEKR
jgi:hypothetical protein